MKLSFVIPCYGSEETIELVLGEVIGIVSNRPEWEYEIICVNDQSPDGVLSVLKRAANGNHRMTVVDLAKNMGKHSAVMAGYSFVSGDYIVNLDDDGQCPLDRLWDMVDLCVNGHDVIMAKYRVKRQSAFKNFGSRINSHMTRWLLGKPPTLHFENFSVVKRFVIDEMLRYPHSYPYLEGLLLRTTNDIVNLDMVERERYAGIGNFTLKKSLRLWLNGFTAFSVKPLRLSTYAGFIASMVGFLFGIYIIVRKLTTPETPIGYSSTMATQLFIGGLILFSLGLIGEYIGRIYICVNRSPQYVVKEVYKGHPISI